MSAVEKLAEARLGELAGEMETIYTLFPALRPAHVGPPAPGEQNPPPKPLHWTQKPENKAKLMRMRRKQGKARSNGRR